MQKFGVMKAYLESGTYINKDKSQLLSSARVMKSSPTKDSIDDSAHKLHRTNSDGIFVLSSEKQPSQTSSIVSYK